MMNRHPFHWLVPVAFLVLSACAATTPPQEQTAAAPAAGAPVTPADQAYRETGLASWYGREFHGRKTASGDVFDMNAMSAAHRTLPLGTMITVTNLENFKSVSVKVIDRGPLVRNRILDLSYGAAKQLGFVAQGAAQVKIETQGPVGSGAALYTVLAASFTEEENAKLLKERLNRKYEVVHILPVATNLATLFRVQVGAYPTEEKAERIAAKLKLDGLEPLVLRKD